MGDKKRKARLESGDKFCTNCKYRESEMLEWPCLACSNPDFKYFEPSFRWCCKAALRVFKREVRELWRIITHDH